MAPWLGRNLTTFGAAFPSAGGHTLWITSYNEQFSLAADPSLASYLEWGLVNIVGSKLAAWWEITWRTVVLLGGIFGFLFFAGLWREPRHRDPTIHRDEAVQRLVVRARPQVVPVAHVDPFHVHRDAPDAAAADSTGTRSFRATDRLDDRVQLLEELRPVLLRERGRA